MGMYDTINGEQVKCFTYVLSDKGEPWYSGGGLQYYGTGDKVPYKKPHYNYGKNFVILDLNRCPESDYYCPYDYILHVIVDGKVKDTFENKVGDIDWTINNTVVSYSGELLNIHSSDDVVNYIKSQRKYWEEYDNIHKRSNDLFREMMHYSYGIGLLDKDSEERKMRNEKINEILKLLDEEKENIKPDLKRLSDEYSYLYVDTSDIDDLIILGEYLSACNCGNEYHRKTCKNTIRNLLDANDSLYDRYVEWQESDEYIKEFKI